MSAAITGRLRRLFGRKDGQQEKPAPARPNRRLTRAERKQIEAVIAGSKRNERRELSAQDSIPYQRMFPDGICRVTDTYYTKTVQFQDINYQLSQNDDKAAIFEGWSDFLNFFDSSVHVQISCLDLSTPHDSAAANIVIPPQKDDFNDVRREYTGILQSQFATLVNEALSSCFQKFRQAGLWFVLPFYAPMCCFLADFPEISSYFPLDFIPLDSF